MFLGVGFEHVRVLLWIPPPQLFEQDTHVVQAPQLPLTGHNLQLFMQLGFIYLGFLAHSPLLAQLAQYMLLSTHWVDGTTHGEVLHLRV